MAASPVIRASRISKSFASGPHRFNVLQQVSFEAFPGECVFLVGPSGSGKTTLLSIVGCILSPDEGRLVLLDRDVTDLTEPERARFRRDSLGFIFQKFHLFEGLRAWENVSVPLSLLGYSEATAKAESLRLLELVGLPDKAAEHVSRLSLGQKQRVAIARALAGDPCIVLADEPTASLDVDSGIKAMGLLRNLAKETQKCIVVVTHDPRIYSYADRIFEMNDGMLRETNAYELQHQIEVAIDAKAGGEI